jgi:hypothetical protein
MNIQPLAKLKPVLLLVFFTLVFQCSQSQTVYTVQSPDSANVKVFAVTDSTMADLYVYQSGSSTGVGANNGTWFFTSDSTSAQKKIFFTDNPNDAEVWIYYVQDQTIAGWRNRVKTILFN